MRPDLYTKAFLAIIAFPLSLFVVASMDAQNSGAEKSVKKAGPSQVPSIDAEAKAFAQRYWGKLLRRCPDPPRADSYFYTHPITGGGCCRSIQELKGASFRIQPPWLPLSEAEKLNGVTWKGQSLLTARAYREIYEQGGFWGRWTEWKSPNQGGLDVAGIERVLGIRKVNGRLEIDPDLPPNELAEMPACSDLQVGNGTPSRAYPISEQNNR